MNLFTVHPMRLFSESSFLPSLFSDTRDEDVMLRPRLDLTESDKTYSLAVELPGVDEKDISIELDNDTLTISGEKRREVNDSDEKGRLYVERSYGSFQRMLTLPDDVDTSGIQANFDNGVLRVTIPRTEAKTDTRRIEITKE